jgi:hypothetical protein
VREVSETTTIDRQSVDDLMDKAAKAMARAAWFEAERLTHRAVHMARQAGDFNTMASIVLPLQEARRQRYQLALACGVVTRWTEPITEETAAQAGCYLIEPPQVGADARRLRLGALQHDVPAAVLCREPAMRVGLWPIVAVSASFSIRTRVDPPDDPQRPDLRWFTGAMEALGDEAIAEIDPVMELTRRIDAILGRLDAVPEHEKLHQLLCETCREAHRKGVAESDAPTKNGPKRTRKGPSRVKS